MAFFKHCYLLRELKKTHTMLILGKENLKEVNNYRAIILCNVSYKFILKILANRLGMVILKLISSLRSAFDPNRVIHDNVLVAHEILSMLLRKCKKRGYIAVKIDIENIL